MVAAKQSLFFALITIVVVSIHLIVGDMPPWVDITVLMLSLVITGIPHGAIDHVIYLTKANVIKRKASLFRDFFIPYVGLIGLTIIVWVIIPDYMFWIFLLVAAYHFGQSQLFYIPNTLHPFFKGLMYALWGIMLLSGLWHVHWESQVANISSVFSWDLSNNGSLYVMIEVVSKISLVLIIGGFLLLWLTKTIGIKTMLVELMVVGILLGMIQVLPLYTAFAIYFGLWHSMRVILTEFYFLKKASFAKLTISGFVKSFIPFSILSFAGLALLIGISYLLESKITPFMLFLIFISSLTMPHAFFMEKMYGWLSFRKTKIPAVA
jgi:Brp/Blh family beta-carotene 15,15'-monooxygenase